MALMYAGQIIEVAPAAEFFAAPKHPYARALLRALPGGERRAGPLEAIAGTVPPLSQAFTGCRFAPRCSQVMAHCAQTLPELVEVAAGHAVRCLLYAPGAVPVVSSPVSAVLPLAVPAAAAARASGPLLDVQDLHVRFPIRGGLAQRIKGSGWSDVKWRGLTFGVVAIHRATRAS